MRYEIVDGKLSIHPEESKTVKKIYNWFNYKPMCRDVHLGQSPITARRGRFVPNTVNQSFDAEHLPYWSLHLHR